jgi:hypothetical protein
MATSFRFWRSFIWNKLATNRKCEATPFHINNASNPIYPRCFMICGRYQTLSSRMNYGGGSPSIGTSVGSLPFGLC